MEACEVYRVTLRGAPGMGGVNLRGVDEAQNGSKSRGVRGGQDGVSAKRARGWHGARGFVCGPLCLAGPLGRRGTQGFVCGSPCPAAPWGDMGTRGLCVAHRARLTVALGRVLGWAD